jgi:uncharacterized membrane protein
MRKKERFSKIITFIFFIFFSIWIIIQFIAPIIIPSNSIDNLSGITGIYDNNENIDDISFPINLIYSTGDFFCHQKSDRSLYINGNQMPFCSRCTAIWLGISLGLGFMVLYSLSLNNKFLILIIMGILPLGIDGLGQLIGFWESTNPIRILTGLITGLICGLAIGVIIDELVFFKK